MATNADFTFGDGVKKNAAYAVQLPVSMYGKGITIHVEVIADSKLPLLLSLGTMRALGCKLDLENMVCISEKLHVRGPMYITDSGHVGIELSIPRENISGPHEVFFGESSGRTEYTKEEIEKLHRNLRHPGEEKLWNSIQIWGDQKVNPKVREYIKEVTTQCNRCKQVKPPTVKAGAIVLPRAHYFRDLVCIDLLYFEERWYMIVVDFWSKYVYVYDCPDKSHENIIKGLLKWCRQHGGPMRRLHSDNEFTSEAIQRFCEVLGPQPQVSPAEAPWANGLCEKMVHLVKIVAYAIRLDGKNGDFGIEEQLRVKVTPLTALESACEAHNILGNRSGFSPTQLVFGSNGVYASCIDESPVVFNSLQDSGTPAEVLAFMQVRESARRNYMRHEYGDRLKKA